jgi:O-antigen/teichoic acid export membrane protein
MKFSRLVKCEIANIFFFQSVAILLAYLGYGAWSFVWGVLAGSLVSTVLLYILAPWKIAYGLNTQTALKLIKFGIPYQAHGLVTMGKNAVIPIVIGKIVGAAGIGFFNWALNFSALSMFFTGVISRITFPAFSRVQHDKGLLREGIEKSIRVGAIFFFPFLAMSIAFARPTIHYLYTDRWLPALGTFYLLAFSIVLTGPIGSSVFNAFHAVGKPYWALNMNILYLVLNFVFAIPLVSNLGFQGMAVVKIIVSYSTLLILIYLLNRIVAVKMWGNILPFLFPSFLVGAIFYLYEHVLASSFPAFLLWGITGGILCFVSMYIFNAKTMKEEIKDVINALSRK